MVLMMNLVDWSTSHAVESLGFLGISWDAWDAWLCHPLEPHKPPPNFTPKYSVPTTAYYQLAYH